MTTFCFWKKINNNFASSLISQKIIGGFVIMCILSSFFIGIKFFEKEAQAVSTYDSVGGALVVGNEITRTRTNSGSWKGTLGEDGVHWSTTFNTGSNKQIYFSPVALNNSNKMIVTYKDHLSTTIAWYFHQICDWNSSVGVDVAADGQCTGGGWRNLHPRNTSYNNSTGTVRRYEIYDGYFWDRTSSPGTVISTPLSNFIKSDTKEVRIRAYAAGGSSSISHFWDYANLELAIDPVYEPASFARVDAGTTGNFVSDLIGARSLGVSGSNNQRMNFRNNASTPIDINFTFKNVKKYIGANTILVMPEMYVSHTSLTIGTYLWNYNTSQWVQIGTNTTLTTNDQTFGFSFNDATVGGFNIDNYIDGSGEVKVRFLSSAPVSQYYLYLDSLNIMVGTVNTDTSKCEISLGSGTQVDCANTRDVKEATTVVPTTSTFGVNSVLGFPANRWPLDDDNDATSDQNVGLNISFPVELASNMKVTGIHYAAKYNAGSTSATIDVQVRDYSGISGTSGWNNVPGVTTTSGNTYVFNDSWNKGVYKDSLGTAVDTNTNLMNMRVRTTVSSTSTAFTSHLDFGMMSIRWTEESNKRTLNSWHTPDGNFLAQGTERTIDFTNLGGFRALVGDNEKHWAVNSNSNGTDAQVFFDNVDLYAANKIIFTSGDYTSTGSNYIHQICDWNSSVGVDNAADSQCTGGGWRTLHPRKSNFTNSTLVQRKYEIYDGYFWDRASSPGTVISTPLSNFISSTNQRVLVRIYETSSSGKIVYWGNARLEVGIDPIYEPGNMSILSGEASSGFVSDLIGTSSTDITPNDNNALVLTSGGASSKIETVFVFKNIRSKYIASLAMTNKICFSVNNVTFKYSIYDNATSSWVNYADEGDQNYNAGSSYTCSTYATHNRQFPFFEKYVNAQGELKLKIETSVMESQFNMQIDQLNLIGLIGEPNPVYPESSFGTVSCSSGMSGFDSLFSGTTTACNVASNSGYPSNFYAYDDDEDSSSTDHIADAKFYFDLSLAEGTSIGAVHYAFNTVNQNSTITIAPQVRTYGIDGGWTNTPSDDDIVSTSASGKYYSSWDGDPLILNASTLIGNDSIANESMGMRFRTSVSTATSQVNTSYGFVSMGIRYSQVNNQPIVSNVSLNGQNDIALDGIYGQQTKVFATADVYDEDGCNTISASGVMYRSGISEGYGCEGNSTNCIHAVYNSSPGCEILNCSGVGDKTATISCEFSLENWTQPTDSGTPWAEEYWRVLVTANDGNITHSAHNTTGAPDVLSLLSFTAFPYNVPQVINYGLLDESGIASFSLARKSSFVNVGNVWSDLVLIGQDLMSGEKSIPANSQKFTLDHTDLITEGTSLAGAPGVEIEARLKNNDASYTATNGFDIFWGIVVPEETSPGSYVGSISFLGKTSTLPWWLNYSCNESTWQCSVDPAGIFESLEDCQAECSAPVYYSCNESTWQCYIDINGLYESLSACESACVAPVYHSCNESTWVCMIDPMGPYSSLSACESACIAPTYYSCNESTWQCNIDPSGSYESLSACEAECVEPTKYSCNDMTWQCYSNPSGPYEDLSACTFDCGRFSCNTMTWQCYSDSSGPYYYRSSCTSGCVQKYTCNESTWQCYADTWGIYYSLNDCQAACEPAPTDWYTCNTFTSQCEIDLWGWYTSLDECINMSSCWW